MFFYHVTNTVTPGGETKFIPRQNSIVSATGATMNKYFFFNFCYLQWKRIDGSKKKEDIEKVQENRVS